MHLFLIFVPEEVSFMNKWVSVVLCICGLGLGGMMLTGDSDGGRVLIENAPYITDGKINPNHEGKVVIVAGKMATEEPAPAGSFQSDQTLPAPSDT